MLSGNRVDIGDIRRAYNLVPGERTKLKKAFNPKVFIPGWQFDEVLELGHNHAYLKSGMAFGLVGFSEKAIVGLVEHAKKIRQ